MNDEYDSFKLIEEFYFKARRLNWRGSVEDDG